jgi:hypothetical protein
MPKLLQFFYITDNEGLLIFNGKGRPLLVIMNPGITPRPDAS